MSLIWGGIPRSTVNPSTVNPQPERRKGDQVGSAEEARRDTLFYQQAACDLGEGALPSAIARRAQKLKSRVKKSEVA